MEKFNIESITQNIKQKSIFTIPISIYNDTNYNKLRRMMLLLLSTLFEKHPLIKTITFNEKSNIIINIELSCFNKSIKKSNKKMYIIDWNNKVFENLYRSIINKITKNLDIDSEVHSDYLITKIINKNIDINNIAYLNSNDLCPEKSDNIINTLKIRNNQKLVFKTSILYTCRNCKFKKVIIKQVQLKSQDEGFNLSLTCTFCNNKWIV